MPSAHAKMVPHSIISTTLSACLDIEFDTKDNLRVNPREWFIVPKNVIEEAIQLIVSGEIVNYKFNNELQRLVKKTAG